MDVDFERLVEEYGPTALRIAVIVVVTAALIRTDLLSRTISRHLIDRRAGSRRPDELQRLTTVHGVLLRVVDTAIAVLGFTLVLDALGINTTAILASAGIIGVALSFGAQSLVRDYLNGGLLVLEDQFRVGDVVTIGSVTGAVEQVGLRLTSVRSLDGTLHFVPNGEIRVASNHTRDYGGILLDISVAYRNDLSVVRSVIDRTGEELAIDTEWAHRIRATPLFLRVQEFQESGILVRILGQAEPLERWAVEGELRRRLKIAFDQEGIEIPFPQRVIHTSMGANTEETA